MLPTPYLQFWRMAVDISSFQSIFNFKSFLQQWLLDSNMHTSVQLYDQTCRRHDNNLDELQLSFDLMMATNYIGAFCLTNLLLPLLKNSPVPSQIVNVTFFYSSKCAVDPGVVETNIMREVSSCLSCVAFTVLKLLGLLQSPKKGISSVLDAALAQPDISGVYLFSGRVEPLTLLHFRTTANLHMNLGPLHAICLCSHSLLLRLRKFPREYLIVIGRECLHQRKAKRNSMDLKWWQLHGVWLMACSLLSLSVLLHHGCCDRCSLAVAEL